MSAKGLIIAIGNYPNSQDLAKKIDGAEAAGSKFCEWLINQKRIKPADVYVCADAGDYLEGVRRYPTLRERVVDAAADIVQAGQDQTEELFVFYSGHGYCFQDSADKRALDVLVASDFVNAQDSGTKCIQLADLQNRLYYILGGKSHYYFIDACRTIVRSDEIEPIPLGRKLGRLAQRGTPTKYSMFSTVFGDPAPINSDFGPALLDGLQGKGQAKGYTAEGNLYVMFPRLFNYVQSRLKAQKADKAEEGTGEGLILEIAPVPTYTCNIFVRGAAATDLFTATYWVGPNRQFQKSSQFAGPAFSISYQPGDLKVEVTHDGEPLPRVSPVPPAVPDFFDQCDLQFTFAGASIAPPSAPPAILSPRPVALAGLRNLENLSFRARNLASGAEEVFDSYQGQLLPGDYQIHVLDGGRVIHQTDTSIAESGAAPINIALDPGPVRRSIVRQVNPGADASQVDFSETLRGPITDRDLGLWLTIMGAGHIVGQPEIFSKMQRLQLIDMSVMAPDSARIYILAALQNYDSMAVDFGQGMGALARVASLDGVFQGAHAPMIGSNLISISIDDLAVRTQVTMTFPNRVTLFVVTDDDLGRIVVTQMALPVFHLIPYLDPAFRHLLEPDEVLRFVRALYHFGSEFMRKRKLAPVDPEEQVQWMELLYGKWADPIMTLLPCYEAVRRGDDQAKRVIREVVIPNMERFFAGIPDVAAIAAMLGLERPMPAAPPLFADGLMAYDDWENSMVMPARKLDRNSTWTTWFGHRPM
jgi:hypothetical protein